MKNSLLAGFIALTLLLSGCEIIGGIFKAGVWSGIILVVGVIVLIVYLISRGKNR